MYNEAKGDPDFPVAAGTPFKTVADDYQCPVCGANKDLFVSKSKVVAGFAENQGAPPSCSSRILSMDRARVPPPHRRERRQAYWVGETSNEDACPRKAHRPHTQQPFVSHAPECILLAVVANPFAKWRRRACLFRMKAYVHHELQDVVSRESRVSTHLSWSTASSLRQRPFAMDVSAVSDSVGDQGAEEA